MINSVLGEGGQDDGGDETSLNILEIRVIPRRKSLGHLSWYNILNRAMLTVSGQTIIMILLSQKQHYPHIGNI
ncbi:hypothetical protein ACJX0J_036327, partial [Zea mays]